MSNDLEFEALRLRHRHALGIVGDLDEEARFELFVAVVAPSPAVAKASRAAVLEQLGASGVATA